MHEFYHTGVVIVLMRCHDWPIETKEMAMTDHNSMKANEYAQRQGEMDDMDDSVCDAEIECYLELPKWFRDSCGALDYGRGGPLDDVIYCEAKRRVMQAIKERNEP